MLWPIGHLSTRGMRDVETWDSQWEVNVCPAMWPQPVRRHWRLIPLVLLKGIFCSHFSMVRLILAYRNTRNGLAYTHNRLLRNLFIFPKCLSPTAFLKHLRSRRQCFSTCKRIGFLGQLPWFLHISQPWGCPGWAFIRPECTTLSKVFVSFHAECALLHYFLLWDMVLLTFI